MRPHCFQLFLVAPLLLPAERAAAQQVQPAPVGNYHAHLVSESSAKLLVLPALPTVELPADIDRVIREWERLMRSPDPNGFVALFAEDALLSQPTGWARGRDAIANVARNSGTANVRVRAHQFAVADSIATVTGSLGDATTSRDIAKVTFTLRRGTGGWLITSFLRENRPTPTPSSGAPFVATQLIQQLDSARIERALVLSVAYWFGSSLMPGADKGLSIAEEHARVKAENDWIATESAKFPDRLIAFCSLHPLKSYALEEIERCGKHPGIRGIKLHLANSSVDLRKPEDVQQLRRVFAAANEQGLPIVVHMRPRLQPYGKEDAEIFLRDVLSAAPDIPIQIAHLAGWGGWDDAADQAAGVFADAVAQNHPATRNLYFDITTIAFPTTSAAHKQAIAQRIRQLGVRRVVYGSDLADPARGWTDILRSLPLTPEEFATIAGNVAPYLNPKR